jgi:transketolase
MFTIIGSFLLLDLYRTINKSADLQVGPMFLNIMPAVDPEMHLVPDLAKVETVPGRDGYGRGLLRLCETNPRVLVCDADLAMSTRTVWVRERYPDRFIDFGISEQDMVVEAGGLAKAGFVPFVTTYGTFVTGRAWDHVRTSICYGGLGVKFGGAHAGISVGLDGATHQALEDIAITRALPGMTVVVPADAVECEKATVAAAEIEGPVYLRFGREGVPVITTEDTPFTVGRAEVYRDGADVAVVACGPMVYEALVAAEELAADGIEVRVINSHTVKPLDVDTLETAARECGAVVTVEEAQAYGGLGGAVAEALMERCPVPMRIIGIPDTFGRSGQPHQLLDRYGLKAANIAAKVRELL